jgi:hypothetical protein
MNEQQWAFFREFLGGVWESLYVQEQITSAAQDRYSLWLEETEAKEYARRLFAKRTVIIQSHKLRLRLKSLRETDGTSFDHIEVTFLGKMRRRRRSCFVGHRFLPDFEKTLRWNLRQVLEPYNLG